MSNLNEKIAEILVDNLEVDYGLISTGSYQETTNKIEILILEENIRQVKDIEVCPEEYDNDHEQFIKDRIKSLTQRLNELKK